MSWIKLSNLPSQKMLDDSYVLWEIKNNCVFHQNHKIKAADVVSFEVHTEREYIGRDECYVYYCWSKLSKVDRNTFEVLPNNYVRDKSCILGEYETSIKPIKDCCADTFEVIGNGYARDHTSAYYWGRRIKSCTSSLSLTLVSSDEFPSECFAKDNTQIYYDGSVIKNVDIATWKLLDNCFSKDNKRVFCGAKNLPSVNASMWKILVHPYSTDGVNVYCMQFRLQNASSEDWVYLGSDYSKDNQNVYFVNRRIPDVDISTFQVQEDGRAFDKNGQIQNGSRVE